jgi:NAD(P)-dependent dehydrogenase (short-subunit alcohol dehydrogenase family)
MQLEGKVAIVTGGGRGIGRAIARRFANEGAKVVIAEQDPESGARTCAEVRADGGGAIFIQTDVSDRQAVETMVEATVQQFGQIDIVVNNAGLTGENGPFLDVSQEIWDRVVRVNQTAVFICSQVAGRVMARAGGGSIINLSSVNGLVPQPNCCAYAAAKSAVESLTRSMAIDLAPYNIRVNTIAPGPIETRLPDGAPPRETDSTLLGRTGLPQEIAAVAVFLASDESSFITGERIGVDGGKLVNSYRIYGIKRPPA